MLKGIDVSGHNGWPFNSVTEAGYLESDFVIVKATQGTGFVNSGFSGAADRTLGDGKLLGFYHYASGGDARAEAEHFWSIASAYNCRGIPVLDFEQYQNMPAWNDEDWPLAFVTRYHDLSGVWPMVYVSAAYRYKVAECADHCALWVAGYPRSNITTWENLSFGYKINPWKSWTVWQFTSAGGLDRNWGNLTREAWAAISHGDGEVNNVGDPGIVEPNYISDLLEGILSGAYGNGDERRETLGIAYKALQNEVNDLEYIDDKCLAYRALAGMYGIESQRKFILGDRYDAVQRIVNEILAAI